MNSEGPYHLYLLFNSKGGCESVGIRNRVPVDLNSLKKAGKLADYQIYRVDFPTFADALIYREAYCQKYKPKQSGKKIAKDSPTFELPQKEWVLIQEIPPEPKQSAKDKFRPRPEDVVLDNGDKIPLFDWVPSNEDTGASVRYYVSREEFWEIRGIKPEAFDMSLFRLFLYQGQKIVNPDSSVDFRLTYKHINNYLLTSNRFINQCLERLNRIIITQHFLRGDVSSRTAFWVRPTGSEKVILSLYNRDHLRYFDVWPELNDALD